MPCTVVGHPFFRRCTVIRGSSHGVHQSLHAVSQAGRWVCIATWVNHIVLSLPQEKKCHRRLALHRRGPPGVERAASPPGLHGKRSPPALERGAPTGEGVQGRKEGLEVTCRSAAHSHATVMQSTRMRLSRKRRRRGGLHGPLHAHVFARSPPASRKGLSGRSGEQNRASSTG